MIAMALSCLVSIFFIIVIEQLQLKFYQSSSISYAKSEID